MHGVYLDDIVIHSETWEEHLRHLREVFRWLQEAQLTIQLRKCHFGGHECTYLGHLIGQGGVRPEQSKIQAIQEMQRPQTKKQVRSFLGMVGYYRRFLPHFATKAELSLHSRRRAYREGCMDRDHRKSFQDIEEGSRAVCEAEEP